MVIDVDTAYERGFFDYGYSDECPYSYPDLKGAWLSGWLSGMTTCVAWKCLNE
jgi:ribosome modulation factor